MSFFTRSRVTSGLLIVVLALGSLWLIRNVRERLDQVRQQREFEAAANSPFPWDAYRTLFKKYPTGLVADQWREKVEFLDLPERQDAYRSFLAKYPNGHFARKARERLDFLRALAEPIFWQARFSEFIQLYPNSEWKAEAEEHRDLARAASRTRKPLAELRRVAYGRFLDDHPDCLFSHQVRRYIDNLLTVSFQVEFGGTFKTRPELASGLVDRIREHLSYRLGLEPVATGASARDGSLLLTVSGQGESAYYVPINPTGAPTGRTRNLYTGASVQGTWRLNLGSQSYLRSFSGRIPIPPVVQEGAATDASFAPIREALDESDLYRTLNDLVEKYVDRQRMTLTEFQIR